MDISNKLFLFICISIVVLLSACSGKQKVQDLSSINSPAILKNIAVKVSQDIYDGKVGLDGKAEFLFFADDLYNKAGVPFIGEKIGTTKFKETIKNKKKIAKAMAAYNLSLAGKNNVGNTLLVQLKDNNPVVRSITIIFLGKIDREKYYKEIEKAYKNEKETFVKLYALRELYKINPEKYNNVLLKHLEDEHIFNRTMAASILLKEEPELTKNNMKEALESNDEILTCRALEGMIDKNILTNEDLVFSFINDKSVLKVLNASELLLKSNKEKYSVVLKKILNDCNTRNKLAISISLLESGDDSGIEQIKKALKSKIHTDRIYASRAIINYYNIIKPTS